MGIITLFEFSGLASKLYVNGILARHLIRKNPIIIGLSVKISIMKNAEAIKTQVISRPIYLTQVF